MPCYMAFLTSVRVSSDRVRSRLPAGRYQFLETQGRKKGWLGARRRDLRPSESESDLSGSCFIGRENATGSKTQSPGSGLLSTHWSEHIVELHSISASLQLGGDEQD